MRSGSTSPRPDTPAPLAGDNPPSHPAADLSGPLAAALHSAFGLASVGLIGLSFLGYLITFGREVATAAAFGASLQLDLFLVAFTFPLLLSNIPLHVLDAGLLPFYLVKREQDPAEADRQASGVLTLTFLILVSTVLVLLVLAPVIFPLVFPGYDADRIGQSLRLLWWLLPFVVCAGISNALQPLLNGRRAFHVPPLGQIVNGLAVIACIVFLASKLGIFSLCFGVMIGAVLSLAVQIVGLRALDFRYTWRFSPSLGTDIRNLGGLSILILPAAILSQGLAFVSRVLGSHLPPGNIAALSYAFILVQVLVVIFSVSQSTILYPRMAVAAGRKGGDQLQKLFRQGIAQQLLFLIPLTLGLWILKEPIVRLLLERGRFDAAATELTAGALGYYSISLVPWGLSFFCTKVLYSLRRVGFLIFFHGANLAGALALGWLLMQRQGHLGVALGTSISFFFNAAVLLAVSRHYVNLNSISDSSGMADREIR